MAIAKVQQATGNGATIALNGVTSGNLLALLDSYFRNPNSTAIETTPTDSNGTFSVANSDAGALLGSPTATSCGVGIFYVPNAASGTHTATPQVNTDHNATFAEFSGIATASPFDVAISAKTDNSSHTSQSTGTTNATAQAEELSLICLCLCANGVSDVGFTDPVANYTTMQKVSDNATGVGTFHAFRVLSSTGTQSATFNWTDNEANQASHAAIATFKAPSSAVITSLPTLGTGIYQPPTYGLF